MILVVDQNVFLMTDGDTSMKIYERYTLRPLATFAIFFVIFDTVLHIVVLLFSTSVVLILKPNF